MEPQFGLFQTQLSDKQTVSSLFTDENEFSKFLTEQLEQFNPQNRENKPPGCRIH